MADLASCDVYININIYSIYIIIYNYICVCGGRHVESPYFETTCTHMENGVLQVSIFDKVMYHLDPFQTYRPR